MDAATPTRAGGKNATEWLALIADVLGAEASELVTSRPDCCCHLILEGLSENAIAGYRDYFRQFDTLPRLLTARPDGRALVPDTTTHPAHLARRELTNNYLCSLGINHIVAVRWRQPGSTVNVVGFQRFHGSAPFSMTQGKEVDRLIHHWRVGSAVPPYPGLWRGRLPSRRQQGGIGAAK